MAATCTYAPLDTEATNSEGVRVTFTRSPWRRAQGLWVAAHRQLSETPNFSELVAIALVYFVQGVTDLATLAQKYLLKDELGASPAQVSYVMSAAGLPWTVKPAIGLLSDTLPLWGYRRKSYLVAAGLSGALSWLLLCLAAHSLASALGLILLTSAASAVSDVVVDSMVVERARREQQADSGSLQSLCWAAYAVGQVGSAYWSGSLVGKLGPRPVFALTSLLPLLVVLVGIKVREQRGPGVLKLASQLWAGGDGAQQGTMQSERKSADSRRGDGDGDGDGAGGARPLQLLGASGRSKAKAAARVAGAVKAPDMGLRHDANSAWEAPDLNPAALLREERTPLRAAAAIESSEGKSDICGDGSEDSEGECGGDAPTAVCDALVSRHGGAGSRASRLSGAARAVWASCVASCGQLWATVRRREVAGPVVFLFFSSATPAADDAMFFFMTGPLGFTPSFLGDVQLAMAVAALVGVGVYHAFLRHRPLRWVLLWGTLLCAVCQGSSLVLATRANVALGLDDHWFALGDSVLVSVIQNVLFMPTMVLSARICPPGMEATLFASLMSIGNIATGLRYMLGAALMQLLGVTATNFDRLPLLIAICSVSLLMPLPLLAFVPKQLDLEDEAKAMTGAHTGADADTEAGGGAPAEVGAMSVPGNVETEGGGSGGDLAGPGHASMTARAADSAMRGGVGHGNECSAGPEVGSRAERDQQGIDVAESRSGAEGLPVSRDARAAPVESGQWRAEVAEGTAGRGSEAHGGGVWWSEEGIHYRRH